MPNKEVICNYIVYRCVEKDIMQYAIFFYLWSYVICTQYCVYCCVKEDRYSTPEVMSFVCGVCDMVTQTIYSNTVPLPKIMYCRVK